MSIFILIAAGLVWFAAVFVWDHLSDAKKYRRGQTIDHDSEYLLRLLLLFPASLFLAFATKKSGGVFLDGFLFSLIFFGFFFWILFDGLFNKLVLKVRFWAVVGTTSFLDKLQQNLGEKTSKIIKIVMVALSLLYYLLTL